MCKLNKNEHYKKNDHYKKMNITKKNDHYKKMTITNKNSQASLILILTFGSYLSSLRGCSSSIGTSSTIPIGSSGSTSLGFLGTTTTLVMTTDLRTNFFSPSGVVSSSTVHSYLEGEKKKVG